MNKKTWGVCLLAGMLLAASSAGAIEGDGHRYGPWITKRTATCTQEGHEFKYCKDCDHWEQRYTDKLPHTPDEWVIEKEPTCTEEGVQTATCTVCGRKMRKKIDKLGHDWAASTVTEEPTCHKTGTGELVCQRCGAGKSGRIDKLDHQWGEWTVLKAPEGDKKGLREAACVLCGDKQSERFYTEGTLYEGMKPCPEVIRMQTMLKDLGYYGGSIRSGEYGALTGKAVARFRRDHELPEALTADVKTLELIEIKWEEKTGRDASELEKEAVEEGK